MTNLNQDSNDSSSAERSEASRGRGFGAAGRVTALAASVMDLHVRIALQEVDREKRRLISGGVFLAMGGILMLLALIAREEELPLLDGDRPDLEMGAAPGRWLDQNRRTLQRYQALVRTAVTLDALLDAEDNPRDFNAGSLG